MQPFRSGTMLLIVVLWFGISAPLSLVGSYFGSKHGVCCFILRTSDSHGIAKALRHPVRVNQIPRQIPQIPRYLQPWVSTNSSLTLSW